MSTVYEDSIVRVNMNEAAAKPGRAPSQRKGFISTLLGGHLIAFFKTNCDTGMHGRRCTSASYIHSYVVIMDDHIRIETFTIITQTQKP